MADFFLSNLKSTLDNCITELDEIHSMFCRNPESDFTRTANFLSANIFSLCSRCRVNPFQMQ